MSLEAELAFFASHKEQWLRDHEGRFVLIRGTDFSFFDSDEEAYRAGIDKWGDEPILIKQILRDDLVEDSPALLYGLLNVSI